MAEFKEVMRRARMFCKGDCCDCPACKLQCVAVPYDCTDEDIENFERVIMQAKEPVDWSTVKVDTPVIIHEHNTLLKYKTSLKRYFAKYEDGKIYTFRGGATSWSSQDYWTGAEDKVAWDINDVSLFYSPSGEVL